MPQIGGGGVVSSSSQIADGIILNADIATNAAIARSKLDFGSGLVDADIAAAAAIARSKLNFGSGLVDADIAAAAAIALSKLATDPLARANHTGTQLSTTISDFAAAVAAAIPAVNIVQDVALDTGTAIPINHTTITSNADGSIIFVGVQVSGSIKIYRLARDTGTGHYMMTHTATLSVDTTTKVGMAVVGSFLYVNGTIGAADSLRRYAIADLSGVTSMTWSGTSHNSSAVWSDGTFLYINGSANVCTKYSISGTTATNVSDITYTSLGFTGTAIGDGTSVWFWDGTATFAKYPIAGGAATSTTSTLIPISAAYPNASVTFGLFKATASLLGIGWTFNFYLGATVNGAAVHLMAITSF